MNCQIWIDRVQRDAEDVASKIDKSLVAIGHTPSAGERWAVKLNLTYPKHIPGVVNSPLFVEGLCIWARNQRVQLQLLEGDGGNGSYSAEDAFEGIGLDKIAARYGAECVNLSKGEWHWRTTTVSGRNIRLPYADYFQRRDYDKFFTAPLFKNHIFTLVSLGMKNLWGCIPDGYRMYYHHLLDYGIVALTKELAPQFSLFDGITGSRGRGPMDGSPVDMNCIMAAGSVGAGEAAAIEIMGVDPNGVEHVQIAKREGLIPETSSLQWLHNPAPFGRSDFILDRSLINRLSILLQKSPRLMRIVYHSPVSKGVYGLVNSVRGHSPQALLVKAKLDNVYRGQELRR